MTEETQRSVFAALGLSEQDERVYLTLLGMPGAALRDLALAAGTGRAQLRVSIAGLQAMGLVSRSASQPPRFLPVAPEVAIDALIQRRQEELTSARGQISSLQARYRQSLGREDPADFVEVISGRDAVARRFLHIQQTATSEVLIFDKPPYLHQPTVNHCELDRLQAGVTYRTIYSRDALASDDRLATLYQYLQAGEQARSYPNLPMKLAIADRQFAIMPLTLTAPAAADSAVLVHRSSLLDALAALFETFWAQALPVPAVSRQQSPAGPGPVDPLLTLLGAGVSDEAIARQLGVSIRTVRRRIRQLLDDLGAVSRFQAGLHAAKRGWM